MSGIVNRLREGVHEATRPKETPAHTANYSTNTTTGVAGGSTNAGPHNSNIANKLDPRVDSDLDGGRHAGMNQTTGYSGTPHSTGTTGTTGTHGSTNAGPHNSNMANKLDPRVDSDLDGGRHAGLNQTTGHTGTTHTGTTHTGTTHTGTTHTGTTGTYGSTNAGPHNSNIANKLDPRVDSDLDGGRHAGMNQTTGPTGSTHTGSTRTGTAGTHGSTNAGPHNSNIANKLDPRVDSDLDGGRHAGMNQTSGYAGRPVNSGTHAGSTNAGPHNSNISNKMDPRVDSDLDGGRHAGLNQTTNTHTGNPSTTTHGTTTTHGSTNAGPHKSNLLNKLDPRVDSDLDGSKNAGMNQTTRTNY